MYAQQLWEPLRRGLTSLKKGDGALLQRIADLYLNRDELGRYSPMMDANTAISGTASSAIRWSNDLLALWPSRASRTRTPLQKGTRAGESRGVREVCPAVGSSRRGRGRRGRQFALGR